MADGLLNKASIILTPTGYKAGTLYNVAPVVEPYEDFDFARASVASRVNSSGLVEMVGRTLGSELVTNGDFATDSDWTKQTAWSISSGVANYDFTLDAKYIRQTLLNGGFVSGKTYRINFEITSGTAYLYINSNGGGLISLNTYSVGSYSLYTTATANGSDLLIYGRNTSGTAFSIDNVSVKEIIDTNNIPRISYDSNGDNGHILLEPTSTNLLPYSEDFSEWTSKTNIEVTLNNTTSPQGVVNAAFINEDNDNAQHFVGQSISITSGQDICISVYAKKNQRDVLQISPSANYLTTSGYANYDLTNGLVTASGGGVTAEIEVVSNNWYRCIAKFTANNTASGTTAFFLQNSTTASRGDSYDGDGSSGLYLWGAQLEALSYATSYIPTLTGSTVTRATETATGAGSATLINSTEGVLYAEIAAFDDGLTKRISLNNGTTSSRVIFQYNPTLSIIKYFYVNTTNQCVLEHTLTDITNFSKIALKWKQNDFALWVDGVERDSDNSGNVLSANTLTTLDFDGTTDSYPFYGKCKALAVFNEALSDAELNNLTG